MNPSHASAVPAPVAANTDERDPLDITIGGRVRDRRKLIGMSQERLAEHLGITFQQVQKYERAANRISFSTLIRIAKALKTRVAYLVGDLDIQDAEDVERSATLADQLATDPVLADTLNDLLQLSPRDRGVIRAATRAMRQQEGGQD